MHLPISIVAGDVQPDRMKQITQFIFQSIKGFQYFVHAINGCSPS